MELSVIIVSYNVREYLKNCLISAIKASERIVGEIFVVDNNSNDGSAEMVRNEFPEVKLIINSVNKGYSVANNQAIKQSGGQYVLKMS
jgi:GT2 family glycosyltransferase